MEKDFIMNIAIMEKLNIIMNVINVTAQDIFLKQKRKLKKGIILKNYKEVKFNDNVSY